MKSAFELEQRYCAKNYAPLPVVLTRGEGIYVWDDKGKRYMDMMSAYSAVSHGHCNPRLVAALKHQEPDRLPLDLGSFASTIETVPYNNLKKYLGVESKTIAFVKDHIEPDEEILKKFSVDTRYVRIRPPKNFALEMTPDNSYIDEWGTRHIKPQSSLYYEPVPPYPLENAGIDDLEKYPWPDPDDPGRIEGLEEKARALFENTTYAIVADAPFLGPLEFSWLLLRGPNFLTDLIENKRFAKALLEKEIIDGSEVDVIIGKANGNTKSVEPPVQTPEN